MSWIYKEEGYNEHPSAIAAPRPSLMPERMSATVAPSRANSLSQDPALLKKSPLGSWASQGRGLAWTGAVPQ